MKLKVTKGQLISSDRLEMADEYLQGGPKAPPPLGGLKGAQSNFGSLGPSTVKIMTTPLDKYLGTLRWQNLS